MDIHLDILGFLWISIWISLDFYGYPFGYPWISMDIHALTCYGFSIQGSWAPTLKHPTYLLGDSLQNSILRVFPDY